MNTQNPYLVLGIKPQATLKEIKKAYRRAGLRYHPDRHIGKGAAEQEAAAARFRDAKAAYDMLVSKISHASEVAAKGFTASAHHAQRARHNAYRAYFKHTAQSLMFRPAPVVPPSDPLKKEFMLLMENIARQHIADTTLASSCDDALAILKTRSDLAPLGASCLVQALVMHGAHASVVSLMHGYLAVAPEAILPQDFKPLIDELGAAYLSTKTLRRHSVNVIAILEKRPDLAAANASALMEIVAMHGNDEKIIAILDLLLSYAPQSITTRDFSAFVHAMGREHQTEGKLAAFGRNIAVILEKRLDLATCAEFAMMKVVKAYGQNPVVQYLHHLFKEIAVQKLLLHAMPAPPNSTQYH